ncbi:hypothetical protein GGX14DRAFT_397814 [Mycena pura]|uniref:Uncharacterized protein n=1 Tax=Mycena pura TaxID=153505 RepID=A0AAD6V8A2_9AGAR|nr:hypothetical protein GGX14DRAFT_397814 [Mycena pura]
MAICPYCKRDDFTGAHAVKSHIPKCNKRKNRGAQSSAFAARALERELTAARKAAEDAAEVAAMDVQMDFDEPPRPPSPVRLGPSGLPDRVRRPTRKIIDMMPAPPPPVIIPPPNSQPQPDPPAHNALECTRRWVEIKPNAHGVYKVYANRPTHDPDKSVKLEQLCETDELLPTDGTAPAELSQQRQVAQPPCSTWKNPVHSVLEYNQQAIVSSLRMSLSLVPVWD